MPIAIALSLQNKRIELDKLNVIYKDLGLIKYKEAWDYQENLLQQNVKVKSYLMNRARALAGAGMNDAVVDEEIASDTTSYFLLCEHPPVYTLGKSGHIENVLISEEEMQQKGIEFYKTNRGGDITFHGPGANSGLPRIRP